MQKAGRIDRESACLEGSRTALTLIHAIICKAKFCSAPFKTVNSIDWFPLESVNFRHCHSPLFALHPCRQLPLRPCDDAVVLTILHSQSCAHVTIYTLLLTHHCVHITVYTSLLTLHCVRRSVTSDNYPQRIRDMTTKVWTDAVMHTVVNKCGTISPVKMHS